MVKIDFWRLGHELRNLIKTTCFGIAAPPKPLPSPYFLESASKYLPAKCISGNGTTIEFNKFPGTDDASSGWVGVLRTG